MSDICLKCNAGLVCTVDPDPVRWGTYTCSRCNRRCYYLYLPEYTEIEIPKDCPREEDKASQGWCVDCSHRRRERKWWDEQGVREV